MTTDTASLLIDGTTDANFRAWGLRFSQALATCGLVKHTDTGQIDWATVLRPANISSQGADSLAGYEIYRFSDTLQATRPVFIKIEYGMSMDLNPNNGQVAPSGGPAILVTVGTGTNGAGTLNGTVGSRLRIVGAQQGSNVSMTAAADGRANLTTSLYMSGDGSSINFVLGATNQTPTTYTFTSQFPSRYVGYPALCSIERTRDSLGAATGGGVHLLVSRWFTSWSGDGTGGSHASQYQMLSFENPTQPASPVDGYIPFAMPGQGYGTAAFGNDVYYYPLPMATPRPYAQALGVLAMFKADVPALTTQVIPVSGANRTYLSLGGMSGNVTGDNLRSRFWSGIPNGAMMMRYE